MLGLDTLGGWLKDLSGGLGSIFGGSTPSLPPSIGTDGLDYASTIQNLLQGGGSNSGSSIWSSPNLWGSVINAGTGLIGSYYQQSENKSLAEQYAEQQKAANDALLALQEKKLQTDKEIAGMYSGATVKAAAIAAGAAKKNTLAGLYNNWANATERGGEATGQEAQNIGAMVGRSLDARQASLSR